MTLARASFRSKLFVSSVGAVIVALVVAGVLFSEAMRSRTDERIQQTLVAEARLIAELLGGNPLAMDMKALDVEADRLGSLLDTRVTLIAADGRVLGDSEEPLSAIPSMENHASRPEVLEALGAGVGASRRHSSTLNIDMLYVAVPVHHPAVGFVRVALPLTSVRQQLRDIVRSTIVAMTIALLVAAALAWIISGRIGHRVRTIAGVARRYRSGDLTPPRSDYGDDELGTVARALDESVQELGRRLEELARDRARMLAILGGMIEGVIVVDAQGRLQLANDAARRMLRLDERAIGRQYVEAIRHPGVADAVGAALAGEMPDAVQLSPSRDPDRTLIARAAPAATAGSGVHGAVVVLHDISDLLRADRIRRDFVANVSHELRTPLTAIRGYTEALGEADTTDEERAKFIEVIGRQSERMERLVKDLLRLARLEAGQEPLDIVPCDTGALLQNVVNDAAPAAEARRDRVEISVSAGAETVRADPAKLHDAVRNLVANAISYAPEQTTITLGATREDDTVEISVADEGPGIPEEDLARVFERFYRVDRSRARDPGGTGLGLAIVKHLVALHGGRVRVENRPGGGAKFTVSLPA